MVRIMSRARPSSVGRFAAGAADELYFRGAPEGYMCSQGAPEWRNGIRGRLKPVWL